MNVIIAAVCLNLIVVKGDNDISVDTLLNILRDKRDDSSIETNEPVEVIPLMPGIYVQKLKETSIGILNNRYKKPSYEYISSNNKETGQRYKSKRPDSNIGSKSEHLKGKILKAAKHLDKYRLNSKYTVTEKPRPNSGPKNTRNVLSKKLLVHILNAIKNRNANSESEEYKYAVGASVHTGPTPENELVQIMFAQILRNIKANKQNQDSQKNKKLKQNTLSKDAIARILIEILKNKIFNANNNDRENEKSDDNVVDRSSNTNAEKKRFLMNVLKAIHNKFSDQRNDKNQGRPSIVVHQTQPPSAETEEDVSEKPDSADNVDELDNHAIESSENDAAESEEGSYEINAHEFRRQNKDKDDNCEKKGDDDDSDDRQSGETDHEKNPGNPYTIHKNKYRQNWLWNHYMDGDHMNINPFGPQFGSLGPSGPELFFGRKWWYFNQDDYKPMG